VTPSRDIAALLSIMARLRTPDSGCPWDLAQTFSTIAPYTIEEAYEVADAIARADLVDLKDELGDLLLQVVFHARMAEECGAFDFGDVVQAITDKLLRRHPHVFGDAGKLPVESVNALWERIKSEEKAKRALDRADSPAALDNNGVGTLAGVPSGLPALLRASKLQAKAARVGFDWNGPRAVLTKVREETDEIEAALATGPREAIAAELGDLLFAAVNLARHLGADPEQALRAANVKFERRFGAVERALEAAGKTPLQATPAEMNVYWESAKATERKQGP
jgi:ATP diphosphatase